MNRRYAWALPIAAAALEAAGLAAAFASRDGTAIWLAVSFAPTMVAFVVVGGLISSRHPDNTIGCCSPPSAPCSRSWWPAALPSAGV